MLLTNLDPCRFTKCSRHFNIPYMTALRAQVILNWAGLCTSAFWIVPTISLNTYLWELSSSSSSSTRLLLVEVYGEVWTPAEVEGTSMISRFCCWNVSRHVDHVHTRCWWSRNDWLRGRGCWSWKGTWQRLKLCTGSFAQAENVGNCLLLLTWCPLIAANSFCTAMASTLHNQLLINAWRVQSCCCCGSKWMVSFVTSDPSLLTHGGDDICQLVSTNRHTRKPAILFWLLQRREIKCIVWPIRQTKAVVHLKDAYKTPARILQVGITCDHLRFAFASFQSSRAILRCPLYTANVAFLQVSLQPESDKDCNAAVCVRHHFVKWSRILSWRTQCKTTIGGCDRLESFSAIAFLPHLLSVAQPVCL